MYTVIQYIEEQMTIHPGITIELDDDTQLEQITNMVKCIDEQEIPGTGTTQEWRSQ